jgi:hypothetical protein
MIAEQYVAHEMRKGNLGLFFSRTACLPIMRLTWKYTILQEASFKHCIQ